MNKMIIPAVVIMAAAPVMVQAADFDIPANATCVAEMSLELKAKSTLTFNNLDFVEIHYTADNNRLSPELIDVKIGDTTYSVEAEVDGDWVAKIPVKATNLAVNSIFVSIKGAGTITVKSATATTGVYQGLVTKYNALNEQLTELQAYPATKKVEKVYPTTEIEELEKGLTALKTWLDGEYTTGTNLEVASQYDTKVATLNVAQTVASIKTDIDAKAKAIADANTEVADAIKAATSEMTTLSTQLRADYKDYTNDLTRALQAIQEQRTELTNITTANGESLAAQTSDTDKDALIKRVEDVKTALAKIANDIADAKAKKDDAYSRLTTQLQNGVTAQATDCPADFAFRTTSFTADVKAIESEIEAVKNTDDILTLDIKAKLDAVNAKIATFNAAVAQAKAIKNAYNTAVTTINNVPSQIATAKSTINGLKTTCSYTDATNGLNYSKTLNLNGKGAELASYENSWKSNGTLITDLNSKWTAAKKLTYTELGATGYTSPVVTAATSIENQKTTDLAAVSALQTAAQDLIDAYNAVFVEIKTVATSWTSAVNAAKGLMMYDKTGYTGFTETTSYKAQLTDQKTAINNLVSNAAAAANTTKTIAQMLAAVKALTNINGDSEWDTIAKAITALTDTQDAREAAFKTDELKAAKKAAEDAWKFYTQARTNAAFVAPTKVDASVLTNLEAQYNALVDQYEEYESYKNEEANVANYTTQITNFKKVSDGKATFVNAVSAYIAALDKAQQAFAQNTAIYNAAVAAVQSAKTALGKTANNDAPVTGRIPKPAGKYYGKGAGSIEFDTAKAYKEGRIATLAVALESLLSSIDDANTACTLYDVWGHDAVKGDLQKQLDALNALIAKVDTDIDKAIALQNTANALEVESLKTGKANEVVAAWASAFTERENEIAKIKSDLKAQIESAATNKWVVDYEATFNTDNTKFDNNKAALKTNLETSQTRYNDRKTLITLVDAVQKKLDAAWISPDFDAIEHFNKQLFDIEDYLKTIANFVGTEWVAGTNYTGKLNTEEGDLQKYAAASNVTGSIDAIVAASKTNLKAKTDLDKKADALTEQLNNTISNLNANKIEVTKNGVTTTKEYTFKTEEEIAKKNAALAALNAFKNTDGEIFSANVAFSGKSVDAEIADRYALGQAATNQTDVEAGILAFYAAINDVMVNLEKDYAGIVTEANEAVKTAFGTAYAANTDAYDAAIAELQKYQDLPAGDFRNQVMVSLTQAVTEITAVKAKADAKNTSFTANDATLIDADGYYDKGETAKAEIEGYTEQIGNILSTFTKAVNDLAIDAFDDEITTATEAYNTAKGQVTSENGWTITIADFADVAKLIEDVQKAFNDAPTALNYGTQVNALNHTAKGYAALIAADKVKYADAQLAAYKKIGQDQAATAKTTVNGYKHLTDAHKSALISGIDGVLSAYETNLTKGVSDLWSGMATVKANSTGFYKYSNVTLGINSTTTIGDFLATITTKALEWDTADWNTNVVAGLQTELDKVSAIYSTLNGKGYAVLTDAADLYEGWDAAAGEGQRRSDLQGQLNALNTWVAGITNELNATHDRTWLAEAEGEKGALRTEIADKLASLTGKNDIVAVFDAANSAYTTWKNNKVLEAYKASADVKAAVALAESWIPQNYRVEDTADYTAIVAKVNVVKAAIAVAKSAEEVDYLAFGKGTDTVTPKRDNIPALLVEIDNHSNANTLVADMAADTKSAIEGFESALAAEKTKQAGYEEGAKSNFSEVDTKLTEINAAYTAALENGTLVFADVQQKMKDAVSTLTSELSTLASKAADSNTVLVKTKANEAGWTKVQGEYAEFEKVYNAAVEELHGYADVEAYYTTTLANYLAAVKQALTSAENTYKSFKNSANKLTAEGLKNDASIATTINLYQGYIEEVLEYAQAAQHAYDVEQACARLAELNDKLEAYWSTANNTLTNYNTTVQASFADEKQAVLDEMAEVESNIVDGEYALDNEAALSAQIEALYGKIDTLLALAADNNKGAAGTGDVDGNGKVTMNDYDTILNFILGEDFSDDADEQAKAEKAADVNNDDRVNVADLQGVLNIYHYGAWNRTSPQSNSRHRVAAYLNAAADNMEAEINGAQGVAEIALNLDNRQAYTSFQFDVKLPEGMQFDLVSLTERAEGLDVQTGLLEDGTIRVVATATDATIEAGTGAVARLNIATEGITDGEIVIDNIVFADNYANAKTFNGFALTAGTVTGIAGNATLTQRVVRSIYNAGGQLMDKVQQGINIIVGENGTAKKVIKK